MVDNEQVKALYEFLDRIVAGAEKPGWCWEATMQAGTDKRATESGYYQHRATGELAMTVMLHRDTAPIKLPRLL